MALLGLVLGLRAYAIVVAYMVVIQRHYNVYQRAHVVLDVEHLGGGNTSAKPTIGEELLKEGETGASGAMRGTVAISLK